MLYYLRHMDAPLAAAVTMKDLESWPATVSVPEAGALLGICRASAYDAARRGDIPTIRIGRRVRVPTPQLIAKLQGTQG